MSAKLPLCGDVILSDVWHYPPFGGGVARAHASKMNAQQDP
jgi:hypothetical protein